jgi:hypothetical protein
MRKLIPNAGAVVLMVLFALMSSCISSQSFMGVKGSGAAKPKNYSVSSFHAIDVSSGFDVILVQGNSEDLTLTVQENLLEYITVKVDNGILKIFAEKNINPTEAMKARITFKSLDKMTVSGGGDISAETALNVPNLDIHISGGGDITTVINTGELFCNISGGGDAKISGNISKYNLDLTGGGDITSEVNASVLSCKISGGGDVTLKSKEKTSDADVEISGGGDLNLDLNSEKLKCTVSGGGDAILAGQVSDLDLNLNGGGDINARNLKAGTLAFHVSGGSDIHVNVSTSLTGEISGGGNVYYTGNPEKVTVDTRGGSAVRKE